MNPELLIEKVENLDDSAEKLKELYNDFIDTIIKRFKI